MENRNIFSLISAINATNGVLEMAPWGDLISIYTLDCRNVLHMSELERECHGVVVEVKSGRVVNYFGKEPYRGSEEGRLVFIEHILQYGHSNIVYEEDYDGIFISFYYWRGEFRVATRRCADLERGEPALYKAIGEAILRQCGHSIAYFCSKLQPEHTYQMVLVGDGWSSTVRYGERRLVHVATRRQKDFCLLELGQLPGQLPRAAVLEGYGRLEEENAEFRVPKSAEECRAVQVRWKGLRVKLPSNAIDANIIQFPTELYKYHNNLRLHIAHPMTRYVSLYKDSLLYSYLHVFSDEGSAHDLMYAFFHALASEIFQIFKKCVNLNTGRYEGNGVLEKLPAGYRRMVRLTRQRMNMFKRLHFNKFTYRYIIDILKEKNDLHNIIDLLMQREEAKKKISGDISVHCNRMVEVEGIIADIVQNNKN